MPFVRPFFAKAGFHAYDPDENVPELMELGEQWLPGDFVVGRHVHDGLELYLQLDGDSRWECGGEPYALTPGMGHLLPPRIEHGLAGPPRGDHHFVYAVFRPAAVQARHPELTASWDAGPRIFDAAHLEPAFRLLLREALLEGAYRPALLRTALDQLVLALARTLGDTRPVAIEPSLSIPAAALRARELLDQKPEARWSVADLARAVGASESQLTTLFNGWFGTSPYQYLLDRRIERAKELLRTTDVPITTLALDLGFSTSQHFANAFRDRTRTSPSAFRKQTRSG